MQIIKKMVYLLYRNRMMSGASHKIMQTDGYIYQFGMRFI